MRCMCGGLILDMEVEGKAKRLCAGCGTEVRRRGGTIESTKIAELTNDPLDIPLSAYRVSIPTAVSYTYEPVTSGWHYIDCCVTVAGD